MIFPIPFLFLPIFWARCIWCIRIIWEEKGTDNIGHDAHFFGALWGVLYIVVLWKRPPVILCISYFNKKKY